MPRCKKPVWIKNYTDWNQVPLLLSVEEVSVLMRWSDNTVRRRMKDGTLKGIREGGKFLITKQSILDLIS